jgi:maltose alpha-D-glucosyltransferase / alpha-amylase
MGDAAAVKLYRRVSAGTHPETEMNRYLTNQGFGNAPSLFGDVVRVAEDGTRSTIAIASEFIRNEGDAWVWILDHITRLLDAHGPTAAMVSSREDLLTDCDAVCRAIGRRLGEMHSVLKRRSSDSAFEPQIAVAADVAQSASTIKQRIEKAFNSLSHFQAWTRDQDQERAQHLLRERDSIMSAVDVLAEAGEGTPMTRIHGDFHLGQVLVSGGDAYIIDFEGEPGTSIAERRAKMSPLRDVAGLLRSIDYVAASLIDREAIGTAPVDDAQRDELMSQFRTRVSQEFLSAYWETSGTQPDTPTKCLLGLFLIEKAAYEIAYEAAKRPAWIGVPVAGLLRVLQRIEDERLREEQVPLITDRT